MIISYNWLQTYFKKKLPPPEKLVDILIFLAFEPEHMEQDKKDARFNVKVLPDRACYALSHRGIAKDIAAALETEIIFPERKVPSANKFSPLTIAIENPKDSRRYIGRRVDGIHIGDSPTWLREKLESIGQRSINNVVDAANFVMFDMGQPLHAFDADKVKGRIVVRRAHKGERMTTLDGKELVLNETMLVIADEEGPLGIAGIKGGKRGAVGPETKRLILEAAHFEAALLRRMSLAIDIRTEASKRFENGPSSENAALAMSEFSALLSEIFPQASFGEIVDEYPVPPQTPQTIVVDPKYISEILGVTVKPGEMTTILSSLGIAVRKRSSSELELAIPSERLDLKLPEDIAEEVGRLYGYDKIKGLLPPKPDRPPKINKNFYWEYKIKNILAEMEFSEILTSSFVPKGAVAIEKPLASDKSHLRENITENVEVALRLNLHNLPLLGLSQVRIFEIGKVFSREGERTSLAIAIAQPKGFKGKKVNEQIREVRDRLVAALGAPVSTVCTVDDSGGIVLLSGKPIGEINKIDGILELNLDVLIAALPEPKQWDIKLEKVDSMYEPILQFPFIVRDIAFFVTGAESKLEKLEALIRKEAGPLARRVALFDRFEKDGRTSFAFRIIFQAEDRTLTDEETNKIMEKVSTALTEKFRAEVR